MLISILSRPFTLLSTMMEEGGRVVATRYISLFEGEHSTGRESYGKRDSRPALCAMLLSRSEDGSRL